MVERVKHSASRIKLTFSAYYMILPRMWGLDPSTDGFVDSVAPHALIWSSLRSYSLPLPGISAQGVYFFRNAFVDILSVLIASDFVYVSIFIFVFIFL
jgi:hypothetical protein